MFTTPGHSSSLVSCEDARRVLDRQLEVDYCLAPGSIGLMRKFGGNLLTAARKELAEMGDERRRYTDHWEMRLAHYSGLTLLSAKHERVLEAITHLLQGDNGSWVGDYSKLQRINDYLSPAAMQNTGTALFFTPAASFFEKEFRSVHEQRCRQLREAYSFRWLEPEEHDLFRNDERFSNALGFSKLRPDVHVLVVEHGGEVQAMAGASADSALMNQIGVDVLAPLRGQGLASVLVHEVARRVVDSGQLPFYGTSPSHIVSQKVALKAGFEPSWYEFVSTSLLDIDCDTPESGLIEGRPE